MKTVGPTTLLQLVVEAMKLARQGCDVERVAMIYGPDSKFSAEFRDPEPSARLASENPLEALDAIDDPPLSLAEEGKFPEAERLRRSIARAAEAHRR